MNLWGICSLLFIGCTPVSRLEQALRQSGDNRPQLEQVLRHYSRNPDDSLKYKAACFLIENMPGHGWYEGAEWHTYQKWIDSAYHAKSFVFRVMLYEAFFQQPDATNDLVRYEDIQHIDSHFLITHLDSTFSAIRKRPWLTDLSFEQVCEYVLPYRVGNERPRLLFRLQDSLFESNIRELLAYDDNRYQAENVLSQFFNYKGEQSVKILYRGRYIDYSILGCVPWSFVHSWMARLGLCPVACDLTPAFPDRNGRHCWSVMINNSQINHISRLTPEINKEGKIYRNTFSHNPHPEPDTSEYVPPFFRSPFYKDVTPSYSPVKDVIISPLIPIHTSYGYLCVFNNREWEPVAYSEFKRGRFHFKDMGGNVVYLPVVYPNGEASAVSYPFILDVMGRVETLQPDTIRRINLKLTRKYPSKYQIARMNQMFLPAVVEASAYPDFRQTDTLATFGKISLQQWTVAEIKSFRKYRYWRIRSARFSILGECFLRDEEGRKIIPLQRKSDKPANDHPAFDDNPITYFYSDGAGTLSFDMGEGTVLSAIECLLRNDGNDVWPGHWYELSYHDGAGWCSLGMKEARDRWIEFNGIPRNALLWLKDLTSGQEERIFTYADGEIRFW